MFLNVFYMPITILIVVLPDLIFKKYLKDR